MIVASPKILLRLSDASSTFADFGPGKSFLPVIGDNVVRNPENVKRVILCSGKHYYALNEERLAKKYEDVAVIRIESLCPFPVGEINNELEKYKNAKSKFTSRDSDVEQRNNIFKISVVVWSQEEHRNMGAWAFVKPRFENMCGRKVIEMQLFFSLLVWITVNSLQIKYYGRSEGGTTAVGVSQWHKIEAADVVKSPFTFV